MNKASFAAYSLTMGALSFLLAFMNGALSRQAGMVIYAMLGDMALPRFVTIGVSASPLFCVFGSLFIIFAVEAIIRPAWHAHMMHAFIVALIVEMCVALFCFGGIAYFLTTLDYSMSRSGL